VEIVESGIAAIIKLFKVVDILLGSLLDCFPALFEPISALPDTAVQIEYPVYLSIAYSPAERLTVQRLVIVVPYLKAGIDGLFRVTLLSPGAGNIEKIVKRTTQVMEEPNR
jgi:hypothetical protein